MLSTDPLFLATAIPAVIIVGLAKGGFGSAMVLLAVPLMSLTMSPIQAAGIFLPILLVMDAVALFFYRRQFDLKSLKILLPFAFLGVGIGWLLAATIPEKAVRLLLGLIVMAFLFHRHRPKRHADESAKHNRLTGSFWGALAGFTSFISHSGTPPFQIYLLPKGLAPAIFAGTGVIFFTLVNIAKLLPYALLGQLAPANLAVAFTLLPVAVLATLAGIWLVKRVSTLWFYRFTDIVLFLVGLKLIYDGSALLY